MSKSLKAYIVYIVISFLPLAIFSSSSYSLNGLFGSSILNLMSYLPYMALFIIGFLGLRLNQTRVLFASIIIIAVYYILRSNLGSDWIKITSLGLPTSLVMLYLFRESSIGGNKSLARLIIGILPIVSLIFIKYRDVDLFKLIINVKYVQFSGVLILFIQLIFKNDKKIKNFITASLISLIAFYTCIYIGLKGNVAGTIVRDNYIFSFTVMSVIMLHAIYSMYWQRVYIDELTDIANRRALDEKLFSLGGKYAIAMIDIDHFKKFNDTYGHDEGDNVLRLVASIMQSVLGDKVYRYGGEEFVAVFEGANSKDASKIANDARIKLEKRKFYIRSRQRKNNKNKGKVSRGKGNTAKGVKLTISIGVAGPNTEANTPEKVIKRADVALYKAKKNGRNRVVVSS